ncbi:MAG TPA: hypothetical protein VM285_07205 [Polyangia bacterium]|nr:hypothetical protein [Polyangia bacterium]
MKRNVSVTAGGRLGAAWLSLAALLPLLWSCAPSGDRPVADCETAGATGEAKASVRIERVGLGRVGDGDNRDKDWCRACVWSKVGFASCQRVHAVSVGEERALIRARARAKACEDAGWPADSCPEDKIISLLCEGDAPPPGTRDPGDALQDLYRKLNPGKLEGQAGPGAVPAPDAGPAPVAPSTP